MWRVAAKIYPGNCDVQTSLAIYGVGIIIIIQAFQFWLSSLCCGVKVIYMYVQKLISLSLSRFRYLRFMTTAIYVYSQISESDARVVISFNAKYQILSFPLIISSCYTPECGSNKYLVRRLLGNIFAYINFRKKLVIPEISFDNVYKIKVSNN